MRYAYLAPVAVLVAWKALESQAADVDSTAALDIVHSDGLETQDGAVPRPSIYVHERSQTKRATNKKKKKKIKVMKFTDFRCKESYNSLVDDGICRTLNVTAPDLTQCATGASTWIGSEEDEKLDPLTSQGEYESGQCAVSIYNQTKKRVKYSRATLGRWWSAATNACMWPGSGYDSAYCSLTDGQGEFTGVILVMSLKGHNGDFRANVMTGEGITS